MSHTPTAASENGGRSKNLRTVLVIDADVQDQLITRRALRDTQIFQHILSATNEDTARELLAAPETRELTLILLATNQVSAMLPLIPETLLRRTVLLTDTEGAGLETEMQYLVKPVTADAIEDILSGLT
jgi:hypothetical protein